MTPKILLVNPPIYDFSAHDFWLKPYGLLRVSGFLRSQADLKLFDYLDRFHPSLKNSESLPCDPWGRGKFYSEIIPKPPVFSKIPRFYRRFGLSRTEFQRFLIKEGPFDFALVQTVMTYWYLGVKEVIEDIKTYSPNTKIVLGGVYATLCPNHAKSLPVDLVIEGLNLEPLWRLLNITPNTEAFPLWEAYPKLTVGVLKLAEGCPFRCSYCSVPQVYPKFIAHPLERSIHELEFLCKLGVKNVVFYDDALLYQPQKILIPFLEKVIEKRMMVNFHTPNALNARFISSDLAKRMVQAGFKNFYLGFESSTYEWQKKTGGKVYSNEFAQAIENLDKAGADLSQVTAYLILAHPQGDQQNVEASMHFAHDLGIRVMLSEFSPIPGTPDGEMCRQWVNLDEPLMHNKTAFPIFFLGESEVNRLKQLCQKLNQKLDQSLVTSAVI
jgi:radical SAM superfamily enzyme YgiQ (UPF0313 family)